MADPVPIGIILFEDEYANKLKEATATGVFALNDGGSEFSMWDLFGPVGLKELTNHDDDRYVVFINGLEADLIFPHDTADSSLFTYTGSLTGYPAITDLNIHAAVEGSEYRIPGIQTDPRDAKKKLTAAGAFLFTRHSASQNNGSAITFTYSRHSDSGPTGAVAFYSGFAWKYPVFAATVDLAPQLNSAEKFFEKMKDANSNAAAVDHGVGATVQVSNETSGRGVLCWIGPGVSLADTTQASIEAEV